MDPPSYTDVIQVAPPPLLESYQELPSYGDLVFHPSPRLQQRPHGMTIAHVYTRPTRKSSPWLTLRVTSRAKTTKHLPLFSEGDAIAGSVDLDLEQEMVVKTVTISVRTLFRCMRIFL